MFMTKTLIALCAATMFIAPAVQAAPSTTLAPTAPAKGVLRVKSLYSLDETIERLKADIAAKGIKFFAEIDQSQLGASTASIGSVSSGGGATLSNWRASAMLVLCTELARMP
jgi:hypothetical protein